MPEATLSTHHKALQINLEARHYGVFAEIGAGQEVARWFFSVGGASGTVAKTISAYDMAISDAIYGAADRYVSRHRLGAMLDYEYDLLVERLDRARGDKTTFFAFANTVAMRGPKRPEGDGWLGIRFQTEPRAPCSEILIHVRMLDKETARQQEALGVTGVNLIHGALYSWRQPSALIASLLDNLTWERIEIDLIQFSGEAFSRLDNRLMALQLVKQGLTEAAMFTAKREPIQWAEVFYKKPVLAQRGSFYPVTNATIEVLERAQEQFARAPEVAGETPVALMEMTLRHLNTGEFIDEKDFIERADMLAGLGKPVLISNFLRFHRLVGYLAGYTQRPIALAMGASKLREIFDASLYNVSEGGLLGGLGQIFKNPGRIYAHPSMDNGNGAIVTAETFQPPAGLEHLYAYLLTNGFIEGIHNYNKDVLPIRSTDVLQRIKAGDPSWEKLVPAPVVEIIKRDGLCGAGLHRQQ
jgi:hypothetical protein